MNIRFHPEAEKELLESVRYYESKVFGLGEEFLAEAEKTLELIQTLPELGSPFGNGDKRMLLNRFPFSIIYAVYSNHIKIHAVMHQKRRPGYWKSRK